MRVIVTGATGFVGLHFINALARLSPGVEVIPTAREAGTHPELGAVTQLDVRDNDAVRQLLVDVKPTHVVHLAGIASVMHANADPQEAWRVHVSGTLHLAWAISELVPDCMLVHVGSGMIYGATANRECPLTEEALLEPLDEYAASKSAADLALGALARHGLKCVRFRPFNHTGPGQSLDFVVPAFAMQVARIEAGLTDCVVHVGNLDAERDFLDVRDVAEAYALAVINSGSIESGCAINIASGQPTRTADVLDRLLHLSDKKIDVVQDPKRMRASDIPRIVGDATRAKNILGWKPRYSFDQTLQSVLDDCRTRLNLPDGRRS